MKDLIPLCEPYLTASASSAVSACLESGWVSSAGPAISEFEGLLKDYLQVEHVVCVTSGTAALHLALLALGVDSSQEIIVPTLTFAASLNPVLYCGAVPILADIKPDTFCIDLDLLENFLSTECEQRSGKSFNKKTGRQVAGVIPVHLYGNVCDISRLQTLCTDYGLFMLEDAAESLGASYSGKAPASFGSLGILSFNGNKVITTGQGGAVVTNDAKLAQTARHLSTQAKRDGLRYIHDQVGYNYRMANINATLGISQFSHLKDILQLKKSINLQYRQNLSELPLRFQEPSSAVKHSNWITTVVFDEGSVNSWEDLGPHLTASGIQFRPLWYPLHMLSPYQDLQTIGGRAAEQVYQYGLCLPSSAGLTSQQLTRVTDTLKDFFKRKL